VCFLMILNEKSFNNVYFRHISEFLKIDKFRFLFSLMNIKIMPYI